MPESEDNSSAIPDPDEFDHESAEITDRLAFRSSFSETLSQHGFPDTLVLARESAAELFHERRLDIIHHLSDHDPHSVRALAEELGYDKAAVSRDLADLAGIDVIEYVEDGRAKAPRLKHNHVVVEPVV